MTVLGDGNRIGTDGDGFGDEAERNVISANGFLGVGSAFRRYRPQRRAATWSRATSSAPTPPAPTRWATPSRGSTWPTAEPANRIGTDGNGVGDAAERNIISANGGSGIIVQMTPGGNLIAGNFIGTGINGEPLGNGAAAIDGLDSGDQIGGSPALANTIAYNNGGVIVRNFNAIGVTIRANDIHDNGWASFLYAINGGPVRDNDPGDLDTGSNGLQNFPVIASAVGGGATTVVGT